MLRCLITCVFIMVSGCYAGQLTYDPPEDIYSASRLVLIAKQTGEISDEIGPFDYKLSASNFEVIKVFKGTYSQKTIRVMAARDHELYAGKTFFISVDNYDRQRNRWYARRPPSGLREINPEHSSDLEKNSLKHLARVQKIQTEALAELEKLDPDAVKRARELRPKIVELGTPSAVRPNWYMNKSVCDETHAREPWSSISKESPLVLRALQILGFLEPRVYELDSVLSRKIASHSDDDERLILKWFKHHYSEIDASEIEKYFQARKQDVTAFCLSFPQREIRPEYAESADAQIPAPKTISVDASLNATMQFLMQSEDPGLYEFVMTPAWAFFDSSPTGEKLKPLYAPLRMDWVKSRLLEWTKPEADKRLREVALIAMGENPTPWLREWIEAQRKTLPKDLLSTLVPALVGLEDENLLLDLWKQIIEQDGSEWNFLWWLRFTHTLSPELAAFAIQRWKFTEAQTAKDRNNHDQGYGAWLDMYARRIDFLNDNDPAEREWFKSAQQAEVWFQNNR